MEKVRARWVQAEINRLRREEQIKSHLNDILDVMTIGVLILLIITAFVVDAFEFAAIPDWVFGIGVAYILIYVAINIRRFTGGRKR